MCANLLMRLKGGRDRAAAIFCFQEIYFIQTLVDLVDSFIFAGGGDFDAALFHQKPHKTIDRVDPERDRFELALAKYVLDKSKPVLGICRGFQLLNIATGGDLIQHLPDEVKNLIPHCSEDNEEVEHEVKLKEG